MQHVDSSPLTTALGQINGDPTKFCHQTAVFALLTPRKGSLGTCQLQVLNSTEEHTEYLEHMGFVDKLHIIPSGLVLLGIARSHEPVKPDIPQIINGSIDQQRLEPGKQLKGEFSAPAWMTRDIYIFNPAGELCIQDDTILSWQHTTDNQGKHILLALTKNGIRKIRIERALRNEDPKQLEHEEVQLPIPQPNCFLVLGDGPESQVLYGTPEGLFLRENLVQGTGKTDIVDITMTEDRTFSVLAQNGRIYQHSIRRSETTEITEISPPSFVAEVEPTTVETSQKILAEPNLPGQVLVTSWSRKDPQKIGFKKYALPQVARARKRRSTPPTGACYTQ